MPSELASAAGLLMGQTSKGIPAVIIRGFKYRKSEEGISDFTLDQEITRDILKEIIKNSIKVIGIKKLLKKLIKT